MSDVQDPLLMIQPRRQIRQWLPFFMTFLVLFGGLHSFLVYQILSEDLFSHFFKFGLMVGVIVFFFMLPLGFMSNMTTQVKFPQWLPRVTFTWLGFFWIWFSASVFAMALRVLLIPFSNIFESYQNNYFSYAFLLSLFLTVAALWSGRQFPRLTRHQVFLQKWPAALNGFKVIQLSDVHVGMLHVNQEFLQKVVDQINEENPDIVVITGDLVEGPLLRVAPQLEPLRQVKSKYGLFFVTGNHEYYHGGHTWEKIIQNLGWTVLNNSHAVIEKGRDKIQIVGVTDYMAEKIDPASATNPQKAFQNVSADHPVIFLAHEPRSFFKASENRIDLQLSGHTHGGQIFPLNLLVYTQQPTNRGLKKIKDTWIFTHMGTGFWGPPMRLGTHSEIAILNLQREVE